jgi:hypothetical protein
LVTKSFAPAASARLELVVEGGGLRRIGGALDVRVPGLLQDALQEDDVDPLVVHDEDPCIG